MEADPRLFPITPQDLTVGFSLQHLLFYGFESHVTKLFADSQQYELATTPDGASLTRHIGAPDLARRLQCVCHKRPKVIRWRDTHHD